MPGESEGKLLIAYGDPFFGTFSEEVECAYYEDGEWRFWLNGSVVNTNGVTHWMPVPEPSNTGWYNIKECGLPPEGEWYDGYTFAGDGSRIVKELFLDSEDECGVHWLAEGDWERYVTHWRERPARPADV